MTLYLASTSPRRRVILKKAGFKFRCLNPPYHEKAIPHLSPSALVKLHALEKAKSVAHRVKKGLMIGADTIVYFKGEVIGKPKDKKDAFQILNRLQGRQHTVYTGVALLWVREKKIIRRKVFHETTKVWIKAMNRKEIARYFRKINPLDKAGAYAIQSSAFNIADHAEGFLSNAAGLPAERLEKYLKLNRIVYR